MFEFILQQLNLIIICWIYQLCDESCCYGIATIVSFLPLRLRVNICSDMIYLSIQ
jgi:hypothetical protein